MSTAPAAAPRLIDGPDDAAATLLLAHGAGAPMDSPFMAAISTGLAARGWRVVRFEFGYMARARSTGRRHGPDRLPVLREAFEHQVRLEQQERPETPLFIGGKSLGGRIASLLAAGPPTARAPDHSLRGCLCFGYPFHPPGKPQQLRTEHLALLSTPTLILQGERDTFGRREEVEGYALSPQVQLGWITGGDHSFQPTRSSGLSETGNLAAAVKLADEFLQAQLLRAGSPP
jgi:predicted alpha/beta-hydrolase family hydrolase